MSKRLLISDANIIIDMVAGELLDGMFALDYEFGVPDLLYADELEERYPELPGLGLRILEMMPETVQAADALFQSNARLKVSVNDCLALSLAKQQDCPLLTGDARLRQLAVVEGMEVHGTLWLVDRMLETGVVDARHARSAYDLMLWDGSRLPAAEIARQLNEYKSND